MVTMKGNEGHPIYKLRSPLRMFRASKVLGGIPISTRACARNDRSLLFSAVRSETKQKKCYRAHDVGHVSVPLCRHEKQVYGKLAEIKCLFCFRRRSYLAICKMGVVVLRASLVYCIVSACVS